MNGHVWAHPLGANAIFKMGVRFQRDGPTLHEWPGAGLPARYRHHICQWCPQISGKPNHTAVDAARCNNNILQS